MRTRNTLLLGTVIVISLALLGGAAWLFVELGRVGQSKPPDSALPAIVRDLDGDVDQAKQQFRQRVHQRFPTGTDAAFLRAVLEHEGFSIRSQGALEWARRNEGRSEWAFFEQRSFVCDHDWTISWHKNSKGKAENIEGAYRPVCL
jgi:hypothetical protein